MKYTLGENKRLKSRKSIESIFDSGKSLGKYPLRVFYTSNNNNNEVHSVKVAVSVPKRRFKRAVDRNLLKRRMREAYRLNQYLLSNDQLPCSVDMMFIYTSNEILSSSEIEVSLKILLEKLATSLNSSEGEKIERK